MTREPRPIATSAPLLQALGACAAASAHVPVRGSRKKSPTLSLAQLHRCEEAIGARLHDDVLALLAIGDPVAKLLSGITGPVSIPDAADEREGPAGWVCISFVYGDPIGELRDGDHGGPWASLFVPRMPSGEVGLVRVGWDGGEPDEETPLGAFLVGQLDDATSRGKLPSFATPKADPIVPPPRLTGAYAKSDRFRRPTGDRVRHPKLGDGVVLQRIGDGDAEKLVIAFESGERTILARFVTPVD